MPLFVVNGLTADLAQRSVAVEAASSQHAAAQARAQGVEPITVRRHWWQEACNKLRTARFPVALFCRELALLLRAGLSLPIALTSLAEKDERAESRRVIEALQLALQAGRPFSYALAQQAAVFPMFAVSSVEAAEGSGQLPAALERVAQYLEQAQQLRSRVLGALLYPALVVLVGAAVSAYLMLFVMPKFADVYRDLGPSAPWMAQVLVMWSEVVGRYRSVLGVVALLPLLGLGYLVVNAKARSRVGLHLVSLPLLQRRYQLFELCRIYRLLVMLGLSGLSIVRALQVVRATVSAAIAGQVEQALALIEQGTPVSQALNQARLATSVSLRLLAAGEQSGGMTQAMTRIADMMEQELTRDIEWTLKVLEPLLMLAIGLVVGVIVLLLYLPIFELASALN